MKRVLALVFFLLASACLLNAQTSWDEYNYCTKGYKDVVEKGLNEKAGYKVEDVISNTVSATDGTQRKIAVKVLKRENGRVAAYIVIYRLREEARQYYCIPSPSSALEIKTAYLSSLPSDPKSIYQLQALAYGISMAVKW